MRFALFALFALTAVALPAPDKQSAAQADVPPTQARFGLQHPTAPAAVLPTQARLDARDETIATPNLPRNDTTDALEARVASNLPVKVPEAALHELEMDEKTTPGGKKYRVYRPKGSRKAEALAKRNSYGHFTEEVYWQAGSFGDTSAQFAHTTGIHQWNIHIGGWFYEYRINFYTDDPLGYSFNDEEGDWYGCRVFIPGQHYIDYNSGMPNIVQVQGS